MREWSYTIINPYGRKVKQNVKTLEELWFHIIKFLDKRFLMSILNDGYFLTTFSNGKVYQKSYMLHNNTPPFDIRIRKHSVGNIDAESFIKTRNTMITKYEQLKKHTD